MTVCSDWFILHVFARQPGQWWCSISGLHVSIRVQPTARTCSPVSLLPETSPFTVSSYQAGRVGGKKLGRWVASASADYANQTSWFVKTCSSWTYFLLVSCFRLSGRKHAHISDNWVWIRFVSRSNTCLALSLWHGPATLSWQCEGVSLASALTLIYIYIYIYIMRIPDCSHINKILNVYIPETICIF